MIRMVARTLAVLTIVSWIVVAGLFARVPSGRESLPLAPQRASSARPLPADWSERVLRDARDVFPGASRQGPEIVLPIVRRQADRFGVDPLTVLAVIQVESQFDAKAVSSAGAKGLMQLEPDTARDLASELGIAWTGDDVLFDPEVNIVLGTYYLRQLLDRFGNIDAALAAYGCGPTLVDTRRVTASTIPLGYSDRVWDVLTALQSKTSI